MKAPANWPSSVPYLTEPKISPHIVFSSLFTSPSTHTKPSPGAPSSLVKIRKIADPAHPAHGQHGLFATRTLPARSHILDYLGYYHTSIDEDPTSDYDLCLDRDLDISIDAAEMGNEGRFVNDYRGIPGVSRANVVFETHRVGVGGELRMGLFVGPKDVKKGKELCVSYGKGFWGARREKKADGMRISK